MGFLSLYVVHYHAVKEQSFNYIKYTPFVFVFLLYYISLIYKAPLIVVTTQQRYQSRLSLSKIFRREKAAGRDPESKIKLTQ